MSSNPPENPYGSSDPTGGQPPSEPNGASSQPPSDPYGASSPPPSDPYGAQANNPYGGQQPSAPYGQPGQPYGQPGQPYGASGPYVPPQKSNNKTIWIVLGVIGAAIVLFCGGCLALGAIGFNEAKKEVEKQTQPYDGEGGSGNPMTVSEGAEFTIDDVTFLSGWSVDSMGNIVGLKATPSGGGFLSSSTVEFRMLKGGSPIASASCFAVVAEDETEDVSCISDQFEEIGAWDEIEVEETN